MKIFIGISSFQILAMFRRGLFYGYMAIYLRHFLGLSVTLTTLFSTLLMILNVLAQRDLWGTVFRKYQKGDPSSSGGKFSAESASFFCGIPTGFPTIKSMPAGSSS